MTVLTLPPQLDRTELGDPLYNALLADHGLTLVAGATESGKSTRLASIAHEKVDKTQDGLTVVCVGEIPYAFGAEGKVATRTFSDWNPLLPTTTVPTEKAVAAAIQLDPDIILIDELRDPLALRKMLFGAACGHYVLAGMYACDIRVMCQHIHNMWSAWSAEMATPHALLMEQFFEFTNVLMAQKLVDTIYGGRCALVEYLILTPENRIKLLEASRTTPWALSVEVMNLIEAEGRSLAQHAAQLVSEGKISPMGCEV